MDQPEALIAALAEEDRRLREFLERCPIEWRERQGPSGALSLKETLGHLAFWDAFAVRFFEGKLAGQAIAAESDLDFEKRNTQELKRLRALAYEEALALYRDATLEMVRFLRARWRDLSDKERLDFQTPLRHRRHHRLLLERALAAPKAARREQADRA